jgi:hypothetical protein
MFRSLLGNLGEIRELPGTSLIAQFNVPWTSLGENSADWVLLYLRQDSEVLAKSEP